jgi:hypothetical protein
LLFSSASCCQRIVHAAPWPVHPPAALARPAAPQPLTSTYRPGRAATVPRRAGIGGPRVHGTTALPATERDVLRTATS